MIGPDLWSIFSNYGLTVIPMFILVGEFVHYGGYNNSLYHATYKWFGHYRGGLAITTIMACAAFSAISGSNTATAATMSSVAIPEMKKYGYHPMVNAGAVAAGSTLGVLIPPSIVSGDLWPLHRPIHRKALFRQCNSECNSDSGHCSNRLLHLYRSSGVGPKSEKEHLAREDGSASGDF